MTMKRMFKEMLTTSRYMKVISIVIVASMLLTLTACGGSVSQQGAGMVTEENDTVERVTEIPNEPGYDIAPGADIPETSTEEPSSTEESPSDNDTVENPPTGGTYTYTVYGQTISMDINVDDYIKSTDWGDFFLLAEMAYSLGWAGNDIYTTADTSDPTTYSSQWYAHHDGDMTTRIDLGYYNEEQIPDTNNGHQFRILDLKYLANGGGMFYAVDDPDIMHRNTFCSFGKHYGDCEYKINGTGWYASYEDIVMIAYIFWSASVNPGQNPMVTSFGTDSNYVYSIDNRTIEYSLP